MVAGSGGCDVALPLSGFGLDTVYHVVLLFVNRDCLECNTAFIVFIVQSVVKIRRFWGL